jgi:Na+/H+-dicarboxylate symporter
MSLSFSSAPGNLFPVLGQCGNIIAAMSAYQASELTNITSTTASLLAQFGIPNNNEPDIAAIAGNYIPSLNAAGAIGQYLVLSCGLSIVLTLLLYPVAMVGGRLSLRQFMRAAAPAQVVAFSTQSSLAALPAMLAGMAQLPGREAAANVVLPLAVSLFRITSPLVNLGIVLFVAHVYGIPIGAGAMAAGVLLAVVTSWSVVGLPSQITFFNTTVPMSLAMGVPLELLPLLLAVEVLTDIFRTVGNVTADLVVTAILTRDT